MASSWRAGAAGTEHLSGRVRLSPADSDSMRQIRGKTILRVFLVRAYLDHALRTGVGLTVRPPEADPRFQPALDLVVGTAVSRPSTPPLASNSSRPNTPSPTAVAAEPQPPSPAVPLLGQLDPTTSASPTSAAKRRLPGALPCIAVAQGLAAAVRLIEARPGVNAGTDSEALRRKAVGWLDGVAGSTNQVPENQNNGQSPGRRRRAFSFLFGYRQTPNGFTAHPTRVR